MLKYFFSIKQLLEEIFTKLGYEDHHIFEQVKENLISFVRTYFKPTSNKKDTHSKVDVKSFCTFKKITKNLLLQFKMGKKFTLMRNYFIFACFVENFQCFTILRLVLLLYFESICSNFDKVIQSFILSCLVFQFLLCTFQNNVRVFAHFCLIDFI